MSKKVLALVLALVMVLGSFSFVSAASYDDVTGTTYEDAVARLSLLGVLEGYPDGSFKPEGEITRAEFAAVAVRAKGLANAAKVAEGSPTGFTDVPANHWASGIIGTAAKTGVVNGIGEGLFAPSAPVKYEEAITMLVRALGYEASAQTKGGYPYGYLIVANEIGILDEVKGTQGAPASRGIVAQMTDNALEIPMMIQVGFGNDAKWVVSGTKEHGTDAEEQYLLDAMGFDSVKGRVTNVNSNRKAISVTVEDEDEIARLGGKKKVSIDVPAGFDIYEVEGVEAKFWYKDDIVISKVLEEAKFDAIKYIEKDEEIELITEDEEYDIAKSKDGFIEITINGEDYNKKGAKKEADYAKVAFNDDDEVIWAQAYTFDGFVVVDEVDGFDVISLDDYNEVDVEDYLIVKDGKEISVEDLEEGDVLYYNDDEEFAVVFNNSKEGEIERVYESAREVKFAGKNYKWADDAIYITEDGKIDELDADILDELMDEEEEVTIFFNYHNKVSVVLAGEIAGTSDYYVMTKNANAYLGRGGQMLALDVRNSEGDKLTFDVDTDFIAKAKDADFLVQTDDGEPKVNEDDIDVLAGKLKEEQVLKITLDKDGDPKEIVQMFGFDVKANEDDIEIDDSKVLATTDKSYRLKSNTVVFYDGTDEAVKLGAAEDLFSEVKANTAKFYVYKGDVVAIVGETDADTDTTTVSGLFEKQGNAKELKNGKWEIKIRVFGDNKTYITKDDNLNKPFEGLAGKVIDLKIGDKSGEIELNKGGNAAAITTKEDGVLVSAAGRNIVVKIAGSNKDFTLNPGYKVYDLDLEEIDLDDVEGKQVTLYMDGNSARYANYIVATEKAIDSDDDDTAEGTVTYIDGATGVLTVDGTSYPMNAFTILNTNKGTLITVGATNIDNATTGLATGDEVTDIVLDANGIVKSFKATKINSIQSNATLSGLITTLDSAALNPTDAGFTPATVVTARGTYNGLTPAQKDYVTNYAKLVAAENKVKADELVKVNNAKALLTEAAIKNANTDLNNVLSALTLPAAPAGTTYTWVSSDTTVLTNLGAIGTQPTYTQGDKTLTFTVTIASTVDTTVKDTKVFTIVVKAAAATAAESAFEAVNTATTEADMRLALDNAALVLTNRAGYTPLVNTQKNAIALEMLNVRPAAGFANLAAIDAAFDTALGL